jgi:hypothetical protein
MRSITGCSSCACASWTRSAVPRERASSPAQRGTQQDTLSRRYAAPRPVCYNLATNRSDQKKTQLHKFHSEFGSRSCSDDFTRPQGDLVIVSVPASVLRAEQPLPPLGTLASALCRWRTRMRGETDSDAVDRAARQPRGRRVPLRQDQRVIAYWVRQPTAANRASATKGRGRR